MSYDQKCFDLALHFLSDLPQSTAGEAHALAQDIQDAVENFFGAAPTSDPIVPPDGSSGADQVQKACASASAVGAGAAARAEPVAWSVVCQSPRGSLGKLGYRDECEKWLRELGPLSDDVTVEWTPLVRASPPPLPAPPLPPTPPKLESAEINALPDRVRRYIAHIETGCDEAGTFRENFLLREQVAALQKAITSAEAQQGTALVEPSSALPPGAELSVSRDPDGEPALDIYLGGDTVSLSIDPDGDIAWASVEKISGSTHGTVKQDRLGMVLWRFLNRIACEQEAAAGERA